MQCALGQGEKHLQNQTDKTSFPPTCWGSQFGGVCVCQQGNEAAVALAEEKAQANVGMFPEQKQAPDGFQICVDFKWKWKTSLSWISIIRRYKLKIELKIQIEMFILTTWF